MVSVNLAEYEKGAEHKSQNKRFTWQPHGSQFTITEIVPEKTLILKIKQPEKLDKTKVLKAIGLQTLDTNLIYASALF